MVVITAPDSTPAASIGRARRDPLPALLHPAALRVLPPSPHIPPMEEEQEEVAAAIRK